MLSTQVNMHTLLSRDPKREVDSEISYVLALALYLLLRFIKDSPLPFFWPRFRISHESFVSFNSNPCFKDEITIYSNSMTCTRGPFSVQSNMLIV